MRAREEKSEGVRDRMEQFKIPAWATLIAGVVVHTLLAASFINDRFETAAHAKEQMDQVKILEDQSGKEVLRRLDRIENKIDELYRERRTQHM